MGSEEKSGEAEGLAAWRRLRDWLSQDDEGRLLLERLQAAPETTAKEVVAFLQRRQDQGQGAGFTLNVGDDAGIAKLAAAGVHIGDVYVGDPRATAKAVRPAPVRFRLPRLVAHFTGRETELACLERALERRS
jgi:hypothetical protein